MYYIVSYGANNALKTN